MNVAPSLVHSDKVAIPLQLFVATTIDDDRCSLNVRILTQQQRRNRSRRHHDMIRSDIATPHAADSNRILLLRCQLIGSLVMMQKLSFVM